MKAAKLRDIMRSQNEMKVVRKMARFFWTPAEMQERSLTGQMTGGEHGQAPSHATESGCNNECRPKGHRGPPFRRRGGQEGGTRAQGSAQHLCGDGPLRTTEADASLMRLRFLSFISSGSAVVQILDHKVRRVILR